MAADSDSEPPLRRGWTTGACATAGATAALTALLRGTFPDPVTIHLPDRRTHAFTLAHQAWEAEWACAGILKDGGDDPDVTHGALILARVRRRPPGSGLLFRAGEGVGTVTRPGLPLAPGEPAINPGPRAMITANLTRVVREVAAEALERGNPAAHLGVAGAEHLGVAGAEHLGVAGAEHLGVAGAEHLGVAGAEHLGVAGAEHLGVAGAEHLGVAGAEHLGVAGAEHLGVAGAERLGAPGADSEPDVEVELAIPGGVGLAERTLNGRLGIVGGLSILGTSGVVIPYSCAAWVHTIHRAIDVARASGLTHLAAVTGKTSEQGVSALYPELSPCAIIDVGDFIGALLKYLRRHPVTTLTIAGGFAKLAKLGAGHLNLHSKASTVDLDWLAERLGQVGATPEQMATARGAGSALAVLDLAQAAGLPLADLIAAFAHGVAREAATLHPPIESRLSIETRLSIEVVVFDRNAQPVGRHPPTPRLE